MDRDGSLTATRCPEKEEGLPVIVLPVSEQGICGWTFITVQCVPVSPACKTLQRSFCDRREQWVPQQLRRVSKVCALHFLGYIQHSLSWDRRCSAGLLRAGCSVGLLRACRSFRHIVWHPQPVVSAPCGSGGTGMPSDLVRQLIL